jgi:hypothetical protein
MAGHRQAADMATNATQHRQTLAKHAALHSELHQKCHPLQHARSG